MHQTMNPLKEPGLPYMSNSSIAIFRCSLMSISLEHGEWLFISVLMVSYASLTLWEHIHLLAQLCLYCIGSELAPLRLTYNAHATATLQRLACHHHCNRLLRSRGYNPAKSIQEFKSTLLWRHMH